MSEPSSAVKRALSTIERLERKLERLEHGPLAIIGAGCRFPGGADSPAAFWQRLAEGAELGSEVPRTRWDLDALYDPDPDAPGRMYTRRGGFLAEDVFGFDAGFFGIAPRELAMIDPQQRLLLEVVWEALEDARLPPPQLVGENVGVFVGISNLDHAIESSRPGAEIDAWYCTGNALSVAAGRISYLLGLAGPSLSIDTACSSALTALHLACRSLRQGECELAIVAAVGLMLSPEPTIGACRARMLAPDGRCKTFDASADGFARGEGCGVVVLRRLDDARVAGDRIRAVVRASAINQDGPSAGLTVPNGEAQRRLLRAALDAARLGPEAIDYVEAHGTGTPLGDPIEVLAIADVYTRGLVRERAMAIGSVKTNVGHLEAAAGMAGLLKLVLALEREQIPAHLHLREPNPRIPWAELDIEVPTSIRPWPAAGRPRRAGLSAFGFSGTNVHVIVEEAPRAEPPPISTGALILPLSARDSGALRALARRFLDALASSPDARAMVETAAVSRADLAERLVVVADDPTQLCAALQAFVDGRPHARLWQGRASAESGRARGRPAHASTTAELEVLALELVRGAPIDLAARYPNARAHRVELPTYPFQRVASRTERLADAAGSLRRLPTLASAPGTEAWALDLRGAELVELADHRLGRQPTLPGVAWIELALRVASELGPRERVELCELSFEQPLRLPEPGPNASRQLQLIVGPAIGNARAFAAYSREGSREDEGWIRHATASLVFT